MAALSGGDAPQAAGMRARDVVWILADTAYPRFGDVVEDQEWVAALGIRNVAAGVFACRRLPPPSSNGLQSILQHTLDDGGGIVTRDFSKHIAVCAVVEASTLKHRLAARRANPQPRMAHRPREGSAHNQIRSRCLCPGGRGAPRQPRRYISQRAQRREWQEQLVCDGTIALNALSGARAGCRLFEKAKFGSADRERLNVAQQSVVARVSGLELRPFPPPPEL